MALAAFYISLVFIIGILALKYLGVSFLDNKTAHDLRKRGDVYCHGIICTINYYLSKIKFKNFHRFTIWFLNFIKDESIYLKRKFDSKQPKFFLKPQKNTNSKSSVSFFLKNVSDYKDTLRNKDQK